eukprot:8331399-Pyramimonas_sp.AAC.2
MPEDLATKEQCVQGQKCCGCKIVFPMDGSQVFRQVAKGAIRCDECFKLYKRIQRMSASHKMNISTLTADERTNMMREAQGQMGPNLYKVMSEMIRVSNIRRENSKMTTSGPFEDPADVEERFKNKPEQWENIKKFAQKLYCPVRGIHLIQVPNYTHEHTSEEVKEQETTRKVTGEMDLKKSKAPKEHEPTPSDNKKLTAPQKKKLTSEIEKLTGNLNTFKTHKCQATASDMDGAVPPVILRKLDGWITKLEEKITAGNKLKNNDESTKGEAISFSNDVADMLETTTDLSNQVAGMIQMTVDAKEEEEAIGR